MFKHKRIRLADDDRDSIKTLVLLRIPPLAIGLLFGFVISFAVSRFEEVLMKNVQVAFFLPFIVYMAAAVGNQTQAIYSRDLVDGKAKFHTYLVKEGILGMILGSFFGLISWIVINIWFGSGELAMAVGLAMVVAIATAPVVGVIVTELLELEHQDPAVGAGPIATVIQDTISVVLYGLITSAIIL